MQTYLQYLKANPNSKPFSPTIDSSQGLVVSKIVAKSPIKFFNVTLATGFSASASDLYIMFFELAAVPANGEVPAYVMPVPAKGLFSWAPSQGGRVFNALTYAVSSTAGTYTASLQTFWVDIEGGTL